MSFRKLVSIAIAASAVAMAASPAYAKCTRLGFSVNDYGKEGPTRDAKNLLDKHIAKWAAEQGITKYTTGKKDVSCELYLDLIVFDEYTCRAEATVCWGEGGSAKPGVAASKPQDGAAITTGTIPKPAGQ